MKKIAFFDVDGTLCDSHGEVLASSVSSIRQFRENGHLAYICTGRSKPEILDSILEVGFDGIIGAGGGYVVIDHTVVRHQTMPKQSVLDIVEFFNEYDVGFYLESNDGLFASKNCTRKIKEEIKEIAYNTGEVFEELDKKMSWFYELTSQFDGKTIDYGNVNKISFINNTVPFDKIAEKYGEEFHMYHSTVPLFGPQSGEIAVKGIDKKKAVEFVLDYLEMDKKQAIAFGDGDNDIAMFEAVGYSIAMENGTEKLKNIADEVTADADEDGIAISLEKNQWI
ncbi:MAG: Cof-type HAD-IIB family hydrolase [Vagococcus sp.]